MDYQQAMEKFLRWWRKHPVIFTAPEDAGSSEKKADAGDHHPGPAGDVPAGKVCF